MLASMGLFRSAVRAFGGSSTQDKPKAKIVRVVRLTTLGQHAWCETEHGRDIRKPLASIPAGRLREFREREVGV